jgi:hypothetical protein
LEEALLGTEYTGLHSVVLDVPPAWLDLVELGRVRRQEEEVQAPHFEGLQAPLDALGFVDGVVVEHDPHRRLCEAGRQALQEVDEDLRGELVVGRVPREGLAGEVGANSVDPAALGRLVFNELPLPDEPPRVADRQGRSEAALVEEA